MSSIDNFLPPFIPHPKGKLSEEDDWRKIQDRKEKKKVQNRVAQRAYRNRIKSRLENFEAMLAINENNKKSDASVLPSSTHSHDNFHSVAISEPHVLSRDTAPHFAHILQQSIRGQPGSGEMDSFHANSETSGQKPQYPDALISQTLQQSHPATTKKVIQELLDMLSSESQQSDKLESLYDETGSWDSGKQASALPNASQVELPNNIILPITSAGSDTCLKFGTQKDVEGWGQDTMMSNAAQTPSSRNSLAAQSVTSSDYTATAESLDFTSVFAETIAATNIDSSLDERLESIIDSAAQLGFENFDSLAKDYYKHAFDDASSSIANEQRMSRNRRLPTVFAEIFSAAAHWSEWERRGFFEEVVRMTESLLISEASACQNVLEERLRPLIKACVDGQIPNGLDLRSISRLMQNHVSISDFYQSLIDSGAVSLLVTS